MWKNNCYETPISSSYQLYRSGAAPRADSTVDYCSRRKRGVSTLLGVWDWMKHQFVIIHLLVNTNHGTCMSWRECTYCSISICTVRTSTQQYLNIYDYNQSQLKWHNTTHDFPRHFLILTLNVVVSVNHVDIYFMFWILHPVMSYNHPYLC